jgi:hypothetical protein
MPMMGRTIRSIFRTNLRLSSTISLPLNPRRDSGSRWYASLVPSIFDEVDVLVGYMAEFLVLFMAISMVVSLESIVMVRGNFGKKFEAADSRTRRRGERYCWVPKDRVDHKIQTTQHYFLYNEPLVNGLSQCQHVTTQSRRRTLALSLSFLWNRTRAILAPSLIAESGVHILAQDL